jgi:lipopolysaccharide export system ATP-binding protein
LTTSEARALCLPSENYVEIATEELIKVYRGRRVVKGVSLEMKQGEIVGLLGPNGAGKTTTFYMIVGLVRPNRGRVLLDGKDITRMPMYRRARAGIGYLAQEASVFRELSVADNIRLVLQFTKLSRADQEKRMKDLLEELRIDHLRSSKG